MKGFKKLTAGFLGVVMALGVCGFTALAEDTTKKIGSMEELMAALNGSEQTWEITDDFEVDALVNISRSVVIDGKGHKLTFTGSDISGEKGGQNSFIQITGDVDVKINDLTIDGKNSVKHCINVFGNGDDTKVALDKVTMKNGGKIGDSTRYGYGLVVNSADVTIENVTTEGNCGGINVDTAGSKKSTLTIESATINEDNSVKIENGKNNEIEAKIEGGTFEGEVLIDTTNKNDVSLEITGGEFKDEVYVADDEGESTNNIKITGGTFKEDVSKYMTPESNLVKDEEGNYVIVDNEEIQDSKFYISDEEDLKLAIDKQADGVTWVFKNKTYELKSTIKITTDVTIEGNGAVLSYINEINSESDAKERCGIHIDSGANVEIDDLTIDGKGNISKHGINVYSYKNGDITSVEVNNVKIVGCRGYAIVNNASDVTVKNIETSGNDWGGINVDNAYKASINGAKFTMVSGTINEEYSIAFENKTGAPIDAEIKDGTFKGYVGYGINNDSFGKDVDPKKCVDVNITNGTFATNVEDFMDPKSTLVKDEDGNFVIMDEEKYDKYLDSKRPTHSYELEEGRVEREDKEDEKNEPVVTPEEEAGPFSDVGKDNPNYDAIIKVYENGWMAGIGDGVFAPNGTLTRAMGATVLWNKAGKPEPQNVAPFLDVTGDAWYAKAVAWAYEQGIIAGYDATTFAPDDALTTEQFTRMNDIANGKTPEIYVGGAPNATRGWVASLLAM